MIVDKYGSLEGMATPTDVLEAFVGEFLNMNEEAATPKRQEDGS